MVLIPIPLVLFTAYISLFANAKPLGFLITSTDDIELELKLDTTNPESIFCPVTESTTTISGVVA